MDQVRALVHELLERRGVTENVADDAPLLTGGLLDSTDVLEIVTFLESRFGVDFASRPFDPDDFDTVEGIALLCGS